MHNWSSSGSAGVTGSERCSAVHTNCSSASSLVAVTWWCFLYGKNEQGFYLTGLFCGEVPKRASFSLGHNFDKVSVVVHLGIALGSTRKLTFIPDLKWFDIWLPHVDQRALLLAETGAGGINWLDQVSCCRRVARAPVNLCKSATVLCFFTFVRVWQSPHVTTWLEGFVKKLHHALYPSSGLHYFSGVGRWDHGSA